MINKARYGNTTAYEAIYSRCYCMNPMLSLCHKTLKLPKALSVGYEIFLEDVVKGG